MFVEVINLPSDLSNNEIENLNNFNKRLSESIKNDKFRSECSLSIVILFDYPIYETLKGEPDLVSDITNFWTINYPVKFGNELLIKHKVYLAQLNYLKFFASECSRKIGRIDVIMLYDRPISSLKFNVAVDKKETTDSNFKALKPKFRLDQVVLNEQLLTEIRGTLKLIEKRKLIYDDWGFSEIDPTPKAIINFYGPPGTGKTMAAHGIAHDLDYKILALNYADIESKYVGEAPKNLMKAFEEAEKENTLLFFDEADSFLGKRISNVTTNADQSINSLRSQMLMLLDNFTGIVIFATNLIDNYDKAFESRIFKHLHFEMPDASSRKKIIELTIPKRVPFENQVSLSEKQNEELINLSDGFSGRYIKNAVLSSLVNAVLEDREFVSFDDFRKAFQLTKMSIEELHRNYQQPQKILPSGMKKVIQEKIQEELETDNLAAIAINHSDVVGSQTDI